MHVVLRSSSKTFALGRSAGGKTGGPGPFRDSTSAARFLRRFRGDPSAMLKLRQLASHVSGPGFHRLGDDEMLKFLAHSLAHDKIWLHGAEPRRTDSLAASAATAAGAPPAARAASSSSAAPAAKEASMFSPDFDALAQAAALKSASESGTPFCEECERRKREQAAA